MNKKIFYYTPIVEEFGRKGTKLHAFQVTTKFWKTGKKNKVELSVKGSTADEAADKLKALLSVGSMPTEELEVNYYLCSKEVIDRVKPLLVSKPVLRKWIHTGDEEIFIALLNFPEIEDIYKVLEHTEPNNDFWAEECVDGLMDVSKATIRKLKRDGLFSWLCDNVGVSKENNIAMSVYKIAKNEGVTPVGLFNKLSEKS